MPRRTRAICLYVLAVVIFVAVFRLPRYVSLRQERNVPFVTNVTIVLPQDNISSVETEKAIRAIADIIEIENNDTVNDLPECNSMIRKAGKSIFLPIRELSNVKLERVLRNVLHGGHWEPKGCTPKQQVAIIVPYRDRIDHLRQFLSYMHPFLQHQKVSYRIFVIEQHSPKIFNKASLMNAGFNETQRIFPKMFNCYIFHDVDMLPENDRTVYGCLDGDNALHFAQYVSKYKYKHPPWRLTGGTVSMTPETFYKINGYSNDFWGWGGEDHDFILRLEANNITVNTCKLEDCSYFMQTHKRDKNNPTNAHQWQMISEFTLKGSKRDGVGNVKYFLKTVESKQLYTWILISLNSTINERVKISGMKALLGKT